MFFEWEILGDFEFEGFKIDTIIVNGCECEPYLTSDYRLMLEETKKIMKNAKEYEDGGIKFRFLRLVRRIK